MELESLLRVCALHHHPVAASYLYLLKWHDKQGVRPPFPGIEVAFCAFLNIINVEGCPLTLRERRVSRWERNHSQWRTPAQRRAESGAARTEVERWSWSSPSRTIWVLDGRKNCKGLLVILLTLIDLLKCSGHLGACYPFLLLFPSLWPSSVFPLVVFVSASGANIHAAAQSRSQEVTLTSCFFIVYI